MKSECGQQVGGLDPVGREPEMGHGDPAGFLGIIGKIGLGIHVRVFTDDLDGVFVGADRPVSTEAPEFAPHRSLRETDQFLRPVQETCGSHHLQCPR